MEIPQLNIPFVNISAPVNTVRRTGRVPVFTNNAPQGEFLNEYAPRQNFPPQTNPPSNIDPEKRKRKRSERQKLIVDNEQAKPTKRRKKIAKKPKKSEKNKRRRPGGSKEKKTPQKHIPLPKILNEYWVGCKIDAHYEGKWYECDVLKIDAKKGLFVHWVGYSRTQDQWFDLQDVHFCKLRSPASKPTLGMKKSKQEIVEEESGPMWLASDPEPVEPPAKPQPGVSSDYFASGMIEPRLTTIPIASPEPPIASRPEPFSFFEKRMVQIAKPIIPKQTGELKPSPIHYYDRKAQGDVREKSPEPATLFPAEMEVYDPDPRKTWECVL